MGALGAEGVAAATGVGVGEGAGCVATGLAAVGRLDLPLLVCAETPLVTQSKRRVVNRVVTFFIDVLF
jgi:hypothetical protein